MLHNYTHNTRYSPMKKQRLSITLDKHIFDAIEHFSMSAGQTKSETINQLMEAAVPSLESMARLNYAARSMTQEELDKVKANLEKVGDFATGAGDKASGALMTLLGETK